MTNKEDLNTFDGFSYATNEWHFKDWEDYLDKKPQLNINDYIHIGCDTYIVIGERDDEYKYGFARILGYIPKEWLEQ